MLRSTLSAFLLAGVFAMMQPTFADPVAATASNQVQSAAADVAQPTMSVIGDKNASPVGSGWG